MSDSPLFERHGAVAVLTINDAPLNRMTMAFMDALESRVMQIGSDESIRSVVLTGEGDTNFSVGMDLKELQGSLGDAAAMDAIFDQRLRVLSVIENMDKPWIATLFGNCLGGGLEVPLACHFRLAAHDGARIGLPELHLGTVPAWGGSARLSRRIGRDQAVNLILRAKTVSGPQALSLGLVTEVWPNAELKERALRLGEELASMPRLAVAAMLRCLVAGEETTLDEALRSERAAVHATLGSADAAEGISAFMAKRRPDFRHH